MKKIELHIHLDGSVRIDTVSELLNIDYETCKKNMVGKNLSSLDEYLTRFDYPIKVMQSYDNLKRVAHELALDLIKDDIIYAEVRFAPIFHTSNLSLEEVCQAVLDGFDLEKNKIKINLILCMMRHLPYEDNKKIIDLYLKHIDKRIVGLDLAGSEKLFPNDKLIDLIKEVKKLNIPFTIHSGEENIVSNIKIALDNDIKRIGHGINIIHDKSLVDKAIKNNTLFEVCPTSNIDTFNCISYDKHHIKEMIDLGLNVCINTDDRTVSNITLNEEYHLLKQYFNLSDEALKQMNINAMKHSFADKEMIDEVISQLK
ncbi:MAG: adenosine deaminase [Acholeplasmatales bacterium]|nr:adenosine deaminase [Acholeplasmatales bacterium]